MTWSEKLSMKKKRRLLLFDLLWLVTGKRSKGQSRCMSMGDQTPGNKHPSVRGESKKQEAVDLPNNRHFCHRDILVLVGILVSVACAPALFLLIYFFVMYLIHKSSTETDEPKFRQDGKNRTTMQPLFVRKRPGSWSPSFFPPHRKTHHRSDCIMYIRMNWLQSCWVREVNKDPPSSGGALTQGRKKEDWGEICLS